MNTFPPLTKDRFLLINHLVYIFLNFCIPSYRQAPEYIYPASFNDCYNVAVGVLNTGANYGINIKKVVIAGDSAGGNLAAAVTQTLAEVLELHCRKQVLAGQVCCAS